MNRRIGRWVVDVRPVVAWYDIWVGAYYDRRSQYLYLMVPFVGIKVGIWAALDTEEQR